MAPAVVKVNKRITDKIRELNGTGFFQKEIRLGAVARKLTEMDVEKALELLQSVAEDAGNYEDPTAKVLEAQRRRFTAVPRRATDAPQRLFEHGTDSMEEKRKDRERERHESQDTLNNAAPRHTGESYAAYEGTFAHIQLHCS